MEGGPRLEHGKRDALTYAEALGRILAATRALPTELIPLDSALGRSAGADVLSAVDMPGFDNAAVDGYALRFCSGERVFRLAGRVEAGQEAKGIDMNSGDAVRVFTGAPVPPAAETVVMQELCEESQGYVTVSELPPVGANIRRRGEEIQAGDRLVRVGDTLTPPRLALLASGGVREVPVHRTPRVGILSTGNELVAPGHALQPGQIYLSNPTGLSAALRGLGITDVTCLHTADDPESTLAAVKNLLETCDVVLVSGGVSVGERDYVKSALEAAGVKREFWGIAVRPGQPFYFGTYGEKLIFGLPGNPVSALVTFWMLVRPSLLRSQGRDVPGPAEARLTDDLSKHAGRMEFVRGIMMTHGVEQVVGSISARGSHMMGGFAAANCLIHAPLETDCLLAGSIVKVTPLNWTSL